MQLNELKLQIELNTFILPIIFMSENNLLIKQYVNYIANLRNLHIKRIESLEEIQNSLFDDDNLYILEAEEFNEKISGNVIILCKKTNLESIKVPKLESWQIIDYFKSIYKGLDRDKIEYFVNNSSDYISCDLELQKISIFQQSLQNNIYDLLKANEYFEKETSIFDLSSAIIKKDKQQIVNILKREPIINEMALHSILYTNFKNILQIQTNKNCTAKTLGISDKQFYVLKKYNCGYYSFDELLNILEVLTKFEFDLKFSGIPKSKLLDYLIIIMLN